MTNEGIHTPITQDDLDYARSLQAEGRLADMYDYLATFGDRYSILARGVVEGDTMSGQVALRFMEAAAEGEGIPFGESETDAIRSDMADQYLVTLQGILDISDQGVISRETNHSEARRRRGQVLPFALFGL
ncbi:hypothetical protein [Thioalkalivibrio sp. ALMg13-2]|uniref:hypothetical protein n=1 Tax=Thioalkalivibrio sp. ALMg13-2 TaxID=1158167 RepID=UPI00036F361C|nr:hypothetical protein [Thioalkalivibrio sp. ALMg13-2]